MAQGYYHTEASVREYIEMAKEVSGSELIGKLKNFLPEGAEILEIGSGPGTDWKLLNETYEVVGSDLSLEFLNHLRKEHPEGNFLQLDAKSLQVDRKFDGIYSNKVLHHLQDEDLKASVRNQYAALRPGGIICHSFWKGEGSETFKGMFVNYHLEAELMALFEPHFEILLLEPYAEFDPGDSLLLIGRGR